MSLNTPSASDRKFWIKAWGGAAGCLGVLDIYRMTRHDDSTLSETIRYVFHTDTPEGKALFLLALIALGRHILH